jgi:hypothetical protein
MRVELIDNGSLTKLLRSVDDFRKKSDTALKRAALVATGLSQNQFRSTLGNGKGKSRPTVAKRQGRPTTRGGFSKLIRWQEGGDGVVEFQRTTLEQAAPYWLIQEIGTGEEAVIRSGNVGDQAAEAKAVRVKAQSGRPISRYLTWADVSLRFAGSGMTRTQGNYDVNRSGVVNQQLMSYKDVTNAPLKQDLEPMRIGKEIEGKHFIQMGGSVANEEYRASLLTLARDTFSKK